MLNKYVLMAALLFFAGYKAKEWFNSPAYMEFILQHKDKPWSTKVLLKTGRFYIAVEQWDRAIPFLDACLSEKIKEFKERPERVDCFYERACILEENRHYAEALQMFQTLLQDHPDYPKARLVTQKVQMLRGLVN